MHLFLFSFRSVFLFLSCAVAGYWFHSVLIRFLYSPCFNLIRFQPKRALKLWFWIVPLLYKKPTIKRKKNTHKLCASSENPSLLPKKFPGLYGYLVISIMLVVFQLNMPFLRLVFSMIFWEVMSSKVCTSSLLRMGGRSGAHWGEMGRSALKNEEVMWLWWGFFVDMLYNLIYYFFIYEMFFEDISHMFDY